MAASTLYVEQHPLHTNSEGFSLIWGFGNLTDWKLGGFDCYEILTTNLDLGINVVFSGNQESAITGKSLYVNGVECPLREIEYAESDSTSVFYDYPSRFTINASYEVDLLDAGGGDPDTDSVYKGTDWTIKYKGIRSDSDIYVGAKVLR